MVRALFAILAAVAAIVVAQDQVPIYVPFEWDAKPATATVLGSSGSSTTYGLVDGDPLGFPRPTVGPATLIQIGAAEGTMNYVVGPSSTLSGVCNLASPVAVCTLNVQEKGAVTPAGTPVSTPKGGSTKGGSNGSNGASTNSATLILSATTIALGFTFGLALLR